MKITDNVELLIFPPKFAFKDKMNKEISYSKGVSKVVVRIVSWFSDFWLMVLNVISHCPFWTIRKMFFLISGVKIGSRAVIHTGARFFTPTKIEIGDGTIVGYRSFLDGRGGIKIGRHTDIASEVMIYTSQHDISSQDMGAVEEKVNIGDFVFIGPRAIILPGVKINNGAVVAAGAIVTKDIPSGKIFGGVPAREIGERETKSWNYRLGRARLFQ